SMYTHLAVVSTAAEVTLIQNFAVANGSVWIGLADSALDGTFVWVTDENTGGYPPPTGAPWDTGEPSGGAAEDCVYEAPAGTFADNNCAATFRSVCECDAFPNN